jgi:hypothetical protein
LKFKKSYFGQEDAATRVDVVICRHVIEHVPEPLQLLRLIRQVLDVPSQGRVFLETPCAEWILRNRTIQDFFYEHCSLFTIQSLITAVEAAGFAVQAVTHVFGGQYLQMEAAAADIKAPTLNPGAIPALAEDFTTAEKQLKEAWINKAQQLKVKGRVAVWGAGAKGVTYVNLIDPDGKLIDCVVDLNPQKQGKYIPGTGHPIVSPGELGERKISYAILMNPNYREEVLSLLQELSLKTELVE